MAGNVILHSIFINEVKFLYFILDSAFSSALTRMNELCVFEMLRVQ